VQFFHGSDYDGPLPLPTLYPALIPLLIQIMPFATDRNWPQALLNLFTICRNEEPAFESRYYGPQFVLWLKAPSSSTLLRPGLPPTKFMRVTRRSPCLPWRFRIETATQFLPRRSNKGDRWANSAGRRFKAGTRIREYGLSLQGTSLRVYCAEKATGEVTLDLVP